MVVDQKGRELLGAHPERPPEPGEPEGNGGAHDGKRRVGDLYADPEVAYRRHEDRRPEAARHARERAERELPDDLLLVLADVLLNGNLKRHGLAPPLGGQPGRVEHPEVDRCGDDDRAASDGGYGGGNLRASLLLPYGEAERDRAPDDQKAAEEGHAARYEADDVCEHVGVPLHLDSPAPAVVGGSRRRADGRISDRGARACSLASRLRRPVAVLGGSAPALGSRHLSQPYLTLP